MLFYRNSTLALICTCLALTGGSAFAKNKGKVKKAESAMMAACKKEYPDVVKGKSFKEVAEWVESEERGPNADTFKKSKCYKLHEDWEEVSEHEEKGEHEHEKK